MSLYYPWPRPCLLPPLLLASSVSNKPTNRQRQRHAPTHLTKTRRAAPAFPRPLLSLERRVSQISCLRPTQASRLQASRRAYPDLSVDVRKGRPTRQPGVRIQTSDLSTPGQVFLPLARNGLIADAPEPSRQLVSSAPLPLFLQRSERRRA